MSSETRTKVVNTHPENHALTHTSSHYFQALCPSLSECLNEVWKGDMGMKGSKEESEGEDGRQTHDAGEL